MKFLSIFFGLLFFCVTVSASDFSLLTSLTTSGDTSGGLRYTLSETEVVDVGVTYDESVADKPVGYWVDYYNGNWGVLINAPANSKPTYSAMFSVEGQLSDSVGIGIAFKVIEVSEDVAPTSFSGWDAYIII